MFADFERVLCTHLIKLRCLNFFFDIFIKKYNLIFEKMFSKYYMLLPRLRRLICCDNNTLSAKRASSSGSYLHNPGSEPLTYKTLGQALEDSAHRWPGRAAVRSIHEGVTLSYEQLLKQADTLGCFLRARGFEKGDRLGIWSHNSAAWVVALAAAARVGLVSVTLNPLYEKPELTYCIQKTEPKGLLIGNKVPVRDYYETLSRLVPELPNSKPGSLKSKLFPTLSSVITTEKENLMGAYSFDAIVSDAAHNRDMSQFNETSPDDGCIMHFTSGTSGTPKAALDSHFAVVNNTYFCGKRLNLHEGHHNVCVQVQMFHALGSMVTALTPLRYGCTIVLAAPTYNVQATLNALLSEKCSIITGTPTMHVDLVSLIKSRGLSPANLKIALTAGATCGPTLARDIKQFMNVDAVTSVLGMTETTAGIFHSLPDDSVDMAADTVGYIMDHVEAKVVDTNNKVVPFGTPGELLTRSYSNMMCYWNDPDKTRETIGPDGWLRTGDMLSLTEDGYARIVGRIKDVIIRGGENIAPREIEDVLDTHPDVVQSQVLGVVDERLGEDLCAVVRLRPGSSLTIKDLVNHCNGRIAKFKIPRLLRTVDTFPMTTTGKIQKYKLKEMIESGKL